jgi:DNA/RNA endonuclease YhcR with UshA esterase domain
MREKKEMKRIVTTSTGAVWLAVALFLATNASAQEPQAKAQTSSQTNRAYDMTRETVLEGKVVQYTASSSAPPLGAHVTVQTSAGVVDVHLGSSSRLTANNFSLASGDSIRIVGENIVYGKASTQFVARVIQKGNQILEMRSARGLPLETIGKLGPRTGGGAL